MSDEDYVANLLAILTDPAPSGFDPADPSRRADDGIDRYDGFDLRLRGAAGDPAESVGVPGAPDATPEVITFVLTADEWEQVLVDQYRADLGLHLAETLADPDPDECFVVFYDGSCTGPSGSSCRP